MLQTAGDGIFVLGTGKHEIRVHAKTFQPLAHDVLEQLAGTFSADRVGVENADSRSADRTSLEDRATVFQDSDNGFELIFGDGEGSTLHGGDALTGDCVAEIQGGGNDHTSGAVDLFQEFVIDQNAAIFGSEEIGPAAGGKTNLKTATAHFAGDRTDGIIFTDFTIFQFRNPDGFHAFGFQHANVFIANDMALGEQFLSARAKYGAAEDPAGRSFDVNGLCSHNPSLDLSGVYPK
jgi:hypothetical protein